MNDNVLDRYGHFRGEALHQLDKILRDVERVVQRTFPRVTKPGAQYGEDDILAELLPEESGIYIDVGAGEPVECSNTWQFYKRGWRGLLIEPLPQFWGSILRQRPRDSLCPMGCLDYAGFAKLRVCGTVSSIRPDWDIAAQSEMTIEVDSLAGILKSYPEMRAASLLSIDVEGSEQQVLEGIDWATFAPRVVIIEFRRYDSDKLGRDETGRWEDVLTRNGYSVHGHASDLNKVYIRD